MAEVLAEHGIRQLHVAETEKYAHVTYFFNGGREQEWAGRDAHPRPVAARGRHLRQEAGDVRARGRRPLRRRDRRRLPLRDRQLREPGHGRPHGRRSRPPSRPSRRPTAASARSSTRSSAPAASASSPPTTATPRRCSRRTASARTRRTRRTRCRSSSPLPGGRAREGGELSDLAPTCLDLLGIEQPAEMTGTSLISERTVKLS